MAFENLKSTGIAYLLGKLKTVFVQIKDSVKSVNGILPNDDGDITLQTVPYAQNLESDSSKRDIATFTKRTSGGTASIQSGESWLISVKGNNVHEGFVEEVIETTVDSDTITKVEINRAMFISQVSGSGTTTFTYSSNSWNTNPATYGLTITGSPANNDRIVVRYVEEERGTITVAYPKSLISTGWNLYNNATGMKHAKVIKYSDEYDFAIAGAYSAVQFSATETGTKTSVTVTDGHFDPFANTQATSGYVWVTGGDDTTAIWMAWGDWTDEYQGEFETYTESEVDISAVMGTYFPNGLLKAGNVVDEIDLNLGLAISRVELLEYSAENRATAEASGREYEFDEDNIYLARTAADIAENTHQLPTSASDPLHVDGTMATDDHGIEYFTYTEVDVNAQILYGNNLKNKLERDVLTISAQTLTPAQQTQVQNNLGIHMDFAIESDTVTGKGITLKIKKWGKFVYVGVDGTLTEEITKGSETIVTVPEKYRPSATVEWVMRTAGIDSGMASYRITTDGKLQCRSNTVATNKQIYGSISYLIS